MSPDDVDSLVLSISDWIDLRSELIAKDSMDNDGLYTSLSDLVHEKLERFCTREPNYN